MNIIISLFFLYYLLDLGGKKISGFSRGLLFLGTLLPIGDIVLRFTLGELWYYNSRILFHSMVWQVVFWAGLALLYWIYTRNSKIARRLLLPIVGFSVYVLIAILGGEKIHLLAPFSDWRPNFGGFVTGYWISAVCFLALFGLRYWKTIGSRVISAVAIGIFFSHLLYSGGSWLYLRNELKNASTALETMSLFPMDYGQIHWGIVGMNENVYQLKRFHIYNGVQEVLSTKKQLNDVDLSQVAFLDPFVRNMYLYAFKHPVMEVSVQNETFKIEISELFPLLDLFRLKSVRFVKNRTGNIVDMEVEYDFL